MEFLIFIIILLYSIILHELAHGYVAEKLGDYTPRIAGRLTLNPIAHLDPIGSILLPIISIYFLNIGFGWAKPVPINPLNFENPRKDMAKVALAGPLTNIALVFVFLFIYKLFSFLGFYNLDVLISAIRLNLLLAFFNLIPIPPLDGSRIFLQNLDLETMMFWESFGFLFIFIIIYIFGSAFFNFIDYLTQLLISI